MWTPDEPVRGGYPDLAFLGLSGIERMRAGIRRTMPPPPIHYLFGQRPVEMGAGFSVFEMPLSPWLQTGVEGVYLGGVTALVADAPLGGAILSKVGPGVFGVTSELSVNFLRPPTSESKWLRATAHVIDVGRSVGLSEAVVEDAAGRVLCHFTSRYFLNKIDPPPAAEIPEAAELPTYPTPEPYLRPLEFAFDPSRTADMSGLDVFRTAAKGDLPPQPFEQLLGMRIADADEGQVTWSIVASEWLTSPARTIYGGIHGFLADAAIMGATTTTLPAGSSAATLDLKVQYLRPGFADNSEWTARGNVVHRGRSLAVARAEIANADGKLVALATGSCRVIERPWQAWAVADEPTGEEV